MPNRSLAGRSHASDRPGPNTVKGPHDTIGEAITVVDRLRRILKGNKSKQVKSQEEQSLIKATVLTWFNTHRPILSKLIEAQHLEEVDNQFKTVLTRSDHATVRLMYDRSLKSIRDGLSNLRPHCVEGPEDLTKITTDDPPDFSLFIGDAPMQQTLVRRWQECSCCLSGNAPLAATVMMGALLETLLLARVNKESNKKAIFGSTKSPKDKSTGKPLSLKDWSLKHYIDVAHDLGWVSQSTKDVGVVLRDYRNYIHPYKELSHKIQLSMHDATLFWEITKSISKQLIAR